MNIHNISFWADFAMLPFLFGFFIAITWPAPSRIRFSRGLLWLLIIAYASVIHRIIDCLDIWSELQLKPWAHLEDIANSWQFVTKIAKETGAEISLGIAMLVHVVYILYKKTFK